MSSRATTVISERGRPESLGWPAVGFRVAVSPLTLHGMGIVPFDTTRSRRTVGACNSDARLDKEVTMRWSGSAIAIIALALMAGGCGSNNFLVYKDGSNFYVTSKCAARQRLLCDSGDIGRIVAGSALPQSLQQRIKEAICATGVTKADMHEILAKMTD